MKYKISSYNTKSALSEALKELLRKKSFSKITVNEISSKCGFNRKTFYYHFEDKYSLLKWTIENDAIKMLKQIDISSNYDEGAEFVIDYLNKNEKIISAVYNSIGRDEMKNILYDDFYSIAYDFISKAEKKSNKFLDEEFKIFICKFYTESTANSIVQWLRSSKKTDMQNTVSNLIELYKITLTEILNKKGKANGLQ
ncbi:MAG: TetR/AcrR family transcriptional regulator C-terminal domain-containing protein [Eubacterium sp.]